MATRIKRQPNLPLNTMTTPAANSFAIGHVGEFHADSEDWTSYAERLQLYFVANRITDEATQRAIFLTVCGSSTYQLIRDLLAPTRPHGQVGYRPSPTCQRASTTHSLFHRATLHVFHSNAANRRDDQRVRRPTPKNR